MAQLAVRLLFCLLMAAHSVNTAKIMMIPAHHYSHSNLFGVAGSALASAGHNVSMMVSKMFSKVPGKFNLNPLIYELSEDGTFQYVLEKVDISELNWKTVQYVYEQALPVFGKACEQVLGNQKLMAAIEKEKFDIVVLDGVPVFNCFYVIPYKFGIKYMTLSPFLDPWSSGVPASAALEPIQVFPNTNQQSFFQRLSTAAVYLAFYLLPRRTFSTSYFVEKYAPEKPLTTTHDLYRRSEMFLINHEVSCVDYPRVSSPQYQFIGGSSARPPKPLPPDLEEFVTGAPHGVIIVTFGSLKAVQKSWKFLKSKMIYALSRLPQRALILYSYDDNVQDFPANVKALKWLPQNDLLGHPKAKLFVTHGGNNGQLEAVYHGVPMLVVPFMGDQMYNGIKQEHHGYGKVMSEWKTVSNEQFLGVLQDLISNHSYTENIRKCSKIIKSQLSTQEHIIFWVDHILEFGGSHLRPPSIDMPLYQVLMVDIIFFAALVFIAMVVTILFCCRCLVKKCCSRKKPKEKKA